MKTYKFKCATLAGIVSFALAIFTGSPSVFSQGVGDMNLDGNLHDAPIPSQDNYGYHTYYVPNQPGKFLYLEATGGDGGKREYTVFSTCTKEGGQGAFVNAWFKIGAGGLQPGGRLRIIPGKKGTDAHGIGIEGAGGGGGSGIAYLPPGSDASNPLNWHVLMAAGGGGGAASSGVCAGSSGIPGQVTANGATGNGAFHGDGGTEGHGGKAGSSGAGGGGWKYPGSANCSTFEQINTELDIAGNKNNVLAGAGYSGSGKAFGEGGGFVWYHWEGGYGGPNGTKGPDTKLDYCGGNFNAGGYGFGGGGSGIGSGGGGGGYSGGGGGGAVGTSGGGGGGGGGSYINTAYAEPFTIVMHQRGTTSSPADGSIKYKFASADPIATVGLFFKADIGTQVEVLKTGDWTLKWQYDGNLVLYQNGVGAKWASNTANNGLALRFQGDGNLVIYRNGVAVWASNTADNQHGGKGGRKLVLTSEGSLFIVDQDGMVIWRGH